MQFENWTDGYQNILEGGEIALDLDVWYRANFTQDTLFPLELEFTVTDAFCNGDQGILSIQIAGGLGGTYGVGGNIPEAENDSNSYVVILIPDGGSAANPIVLDDNQNEISIMVEAGFYVVLVEDAAGNEIEIFSVIMEPEPLELIVDLYSFLCPGDTTMNLELIALGGFEPYRYAISKNGEDYTDFTTEAYHWIYGEGVYEFIVQDANGCISSETFVFEDTEPLEFSIHDQSCYGEQNAVAKLKVDGDPEREYIGLYSLYEDGMKVLEDTTVFFDSEITISGLLFDNNELVDRYYGFRIRDDLGCTTEERIEVFNQVQAPLYMGVEVLVVRDDDADIEISVQGGVAPYRVLFDGIEIQNWQQTVSTGYHSIQLIDAHMCVVDETIYIEPFITCPQHFYPVWDGNPNDAMNIFIIEAKVDGFDLEEGDELGVFDGELCVGYGKVVNTINHQNVLSIVVSADDGTGNGFTPGQEVSYRVWSCSKDLEYRVDEVNCFDNQLNGVNCVAFQSGASSYVQLGVSTEVCLGIAFQTGWNIFSAPVLSDSADMKFNFQDLIADNILVKIQDETGASLEDRGIFGGWKNDIGNILTDEGYKIKVNSTDSVQICGKKVIYPYAIHLNTGWNIIGYPTFQYADGMAVVASLIDNGTLLKVQDEQGRSIENLGIFGGWQNYIGNFYPGKGYKVKLSTYDTLWVFETYPKSGVFSSGTIAPVHFNPVFDGNGVDHMNFNFVHLQAGLLQEGDELAVFDGPACVGAVTLLPGHFKKNIVPIPASAADKNGMPGFTEGNNFSFRLWQSRPQSEIEISPEVLQGDVVFAKHESVVLSLQNAVLNSATNKRGVSEITCYPNPFNQMLTINVNLDVDSELEIVVVNQVGQCVKRVVEKQMYTRGNHHELWNGRNENGTYVSSGVYYLRVNVDDKITTKKLIFKQ
jgi:hypothetical protein